MSDYPMLISNKLHSFRNFSLQIYHNSFTFASGFGQNLSEISEKHEGSYVYPSEH